MILPIFTSPAVVAAVGRETHLDSLCNFQRGIHWVAAAAAAAAAAAVACMMQGLLGVV